MKTIEVLISPTGDVKVQTHGFHGSSCQEASKSLEQALGVKSSEQRTADYFQTHQTLETEVQQ